MHDVVSDNIKVVILTETVACLKAMNNRNPHGSIVWTLGIFGDVWVLRFGARPHVQHQTSETVRGRRCPGFVKTITCQRRLPPHSEAQYVFVEHMLWGLGDVKQGYQEDLANPFKSSTCGDGGTR